MKELLPYLAFGVSVLACGIALYVAVRAGRWRDSDDAKAIDNRINALATTVGGAATGLALGAVATRVTALEAGMQHVATKADIAGLKAEVKGLESTISSVDAGVSRIEDHLMGVRA